MSAVGKGRARDCAGQVRAVQEHVLHGGHGRFAIAQCARASVQSGDADATTARGADGGGDVTGWRGGVRRHDRTAAA